MSPHNITIVILAAGDGKRMKSELPKVLHTLRGKPLIERVVDAAISSGLCEKPVVVVSAKHTLIQDYLKEKAEYVVQHEQLGTGHAVAVTEQKLRGTVDTVVVLYGDMPFLEPESIRKLVEYHVENSAVLTLLTTTASDFTGWRRAFYAFGRIIRDAAGNITRIVDVRDATDKELEIKEVSTCFFCFKADWLYEHLKQLRKNNAQQEYYLTDLLKIAFDERAKVASLGVDMKEAIGINSKEDLENSNQII